MSNNKQSSVEWLIELLQEYGVDLTHINRDEFEFAKMMHKDEILKAHAIGEVTGFGKANNPYFYSIQTPEKYYNETFNTKEK